MFTLQSTQGKLLPTYAYKAVRLMSLCFLLQISGLCFLSGNLKAQTLQTKWVQVLDSMVSFSSPRLVILPNGERLIVTGFGPDTEQITEPTWYGTCALRASNGSLAWRTPTGYAQIFGSAQFYDRSGGGGQPPAPTCIIAGRFGSFYQYDLLTGELLHSFYPLQDTIRQSNLGYNHFFDPQFLPDINGDGISEILVTNCGNVHPTPLNPNGKLPGKLMLVNGADLTLIEEWNTPDSAETYFSPAVVTLADTTWLLWGTGGETLPGSLYAVTLSDFVSGNAQSKHQIWADGGPKGIMQPPVFVYLNADSVHDIVVSVFEGGLLALDGATRQVMWLDTLGGTENYCQPSVGQFVGDSTPDFFYHLGLGIFPSYTKYYQVVVDGKTGQRTILDSLGMFELSSQSAVDINNDGLAEPIWVSNFIDTATLAVTHKVFAYDFAANQTLTLVPATKGTASIASIWIGDAMGNDSLYLVYHHSNSDTDIVSGNPADGRTFRCIALGAAEPQGPYWGAYHGNAYDNHYHTAKSPRFVTSAKPEAANLAGAIAWPNPTNGRLAVRYTPQGSSSDFTLRVMNMQGQVLLSSPSYQSDDVLDISHLAAGLYTWQLQSSAGQTAQGKFMVLQH